MQNEWVGNLRAAEPGFNGFDRDHGKFRHPTTTSELNVHETPEQQLNAYSGSGGSAVEEGKNGDVAPVCEGHSLHQEVFFFCAIRNIGDVRGTGRIYVETVVDANARFGFAKVYSANLSLNAVDILASRVLPFFSRHGLTIKEIRTRKAVEYCGLIPRHAYETYLATSHVQHLPIHPPGHPDNLLCTEFYGFLRKEFFVPALRRKFQWQLADLQKELDAFVEAYNMARWKHQKL
jgi:hypothetical protein